MTVERDPDIPADSVSDRFEEFGYFVDLIVRQRMFVVCEGITLRRGISLLFEGFLRVVSVVLGGSSPMCQPFA